MQSSDKLLAVNYVVKGKCYMKLSELKAGDRAIISEIGQLTLPQTVKRKLLSMGITPNTHFSFIRRAPMGTGVELDLRGSKLCMRCDLADIIEVVLTND